MDPTVPLPGVTRIISGNMVYSFETLASSSVAVIVVVPKGCVSTVHVVVHEPSDVTMVSIGVIARFVFDPNSTRIISFSRYPLPATVTKLPTVPLFGVTTIISGRINSVFSIQIPLLSSHAVSAVVP